MKVIGIDIDDVLRDFKRTVIYYYHKDNNLDYENIDYDDYKSKGLDDILDFKEETFQRFFIDNDLDVYYTTRDKITEITEVITKDKKVKDFLYQDYLLEIYGLSTTTYRNVSFDFNSLISKYKDEYKFIILVKDKLVTFAPSLSFISTLRPYVSEIKYVNSIEDIFKSCDIYVTANKSLINEDNRIILVTMDKEIDYKYKIEKLGDLVENKMLEEHGE